MMACEWFTIGDGQLSRPIASPAEDRFSAEIEGTPFPDLVEDDDAGIAMARPFHQVPQSFCFAPANASVSDGLRTVRRDPSAEAIAQPRYGLCELRLRFFKLEGSC